MLLYDHCMVCNKDVQKKRPVVTIDRSLESLGSNFVPIEGVGHRCVLGGELLCKTENTITACFAGVLDCFLFPDGFHKQVCISIHSAR